MPLEGPWSILDETIWSLTSPRVSRISGPKNFRSSPYNDFFNTIGTKQTWRDVGLEAAMRSKADVDQTLDDVPTTQDFRANRDSKLTNLTAWIASFVRVPCR
jgi:hypothetical protein